MYRLKFREWEMHIRRQDVVLDARDVDVAVRAVALHGTCGLWLILTLSGAALER